MTEYHIIPSGPDYTMTPDDLREALAKLPLSQAAAARALGVAGRTMRDWCAGKTPVPETVRRIFLAAGDIPGLMDALAAYGEAKPLYPELVVNIISH